MSRSRKHSPCLCWCGRTNKLSKRYANKMFRRLSKRMVEQGMRPPFRVREVYGVHYFNRDGLARWRNNIEEKFLRK